MCKTKQALTKFQISNINRDLKRQFPNNIGKQLRLADYPESIAQVNNELLKPVKVRGYGPSLPRQPLTPGRDILPDMLENPAPIKKWVQAFHYRPDPNQSDLTKYRCSPGFMRGRSDSHTFFKVVLCGKEWCKECGSYLSDVHIRRIVRAQPKLDQIDGFMSYLVVTVPEDLRPFFYDKKVLDDFRRYWKRKISRQYEGTKGLMRYHWAGDKGPTKWHPHLNLLFESKGYIKKEVLNLWRRQLSAWFKDYFSLNYYPKPNLYHRYARPENKERKKHWLNYVTRATFFGNDKKIKETIKGYRNTICIGKFEKPDKEATSALSAVVCKGIDLADGSKIYWEKIEKIRPAEFIDETTGELIEYAKKIWVQRIYRYDQFKDLVLDTKSENLGGGFFRNGILEKPPD